jgi:hypothetical protein
VGLNASYFFHEARNISQTEGLQQDVYSATEARRFELPEFWWLSKIAFFHALKCNLVQRNFNLKQFWLSLA